MAALVNHADDQEQRAGGKAVIDHLQKPALQALMRQCKNAEHHKSQMAHGRIRDELFEIGLHSGNPCAINDADERENRNQRRELDRGVRKERQTEAEKSIRAHFQQHTGKNNRTRGRRFDVRVREPRVEWKHRHFDGEREAEGEKKPDLIIFRKEQVANFYQIERERAGDFAVIEINEKNRDEHQQAADHCVDKKFQRRINAARTAPDADDEIHRNEHRFPEDVEEQQVEAGEHAHHAGFQQQHGDQIAFDAFFNVMPRGEKDQRH